MPWELVGPMIVAIILILTIGGVILLRPLSHRLGDLLEAMTEERRNPPELDRTLHRIRDSLEGLDARLTLLEERQDFTEELLRSEERKELGRGKASGSGAADGGRGGERRR